MADESVLMTSDDGTTFAPGWKISSKEVLLATQGTEAVMDIGRCREKNAETATSAYTLIS